MTGLEEAIGINLAFSVQLYDATGGLLQSGDIMDKETVIPTEEFVPAAYYLLISDNQKELRRFKIIKN